MTVPSLPALPVLEKHGKKMTKHFFNSIKSSYYSRRAKCNNMVPGYLRKRKFLEASAKKTLFFNKAKCFPPSDVESPQLKMQIGQSGFLKGDAKFCRHRRLSIRCWVCGARGFSRSNLINKQFGKKASAPRDNFLNSSLCECECGLVEQRKAAGVRRPE